MKKMNGKKRSKTLSLRSSVLMYEQQETRLPFKSITALERRVQSLKSTYELTKYAYIRHDKDYDQHGALIKPHIHLVMVFKKRVAVDSIAKELNEKSQQFEVLTKRGNSAKIGAQNGFMYLIHRTTKSTDKYQYDVSAVTANFDYKLFVKKMEENRSPEDILDALGEGQLSIFQAKEKMLSLGADVYAENSRKIVDVGRARLEIDQSQWISHMIKTKEPIKVVWCYGESGSGKTRFALDFAQQRDMSYFKTGGSNDPLEGYGGEKVLIIDELRQSMFNYRDLLEFLDPYVYDKTTVARYHNALLMSEIIIITTPYAPYDFYKGIKGVDKKNDKFSQLERRIGLILRFTNVCINEIKYNVGMLQTEPIEQVIKSHNNQYASKKKTNDFSFKELKNI